MKIDVNDVQSLEDAPIVEKFHKKKGNPEDKTSKKHDKTPSKRHEHHSKISKLVKAEEDDSE